MRHFATTRTPENIAVLGDMDPGFSTQVLEGVQAFANHTPSWRIIPLHCTQDRLLDDLLREGRVQGVIGSFISTRWVTELPGRPVPLVNVGGLSSMTDVASVLPDDVSIGRLAAEHLLDGGWQTLGCVHDAASDAAGKRAEGFAARAAQAGVKVLAPPALDSFVLGSNWNDWLAEIPLPAAIFCSSDTLARRLLGAIRRLDLNVPEEIAVVGVGDSAVDSAMAGIGISSVPLPGRRIGQRAAAKLHAMLRFGFADHTVERVSPETVVVRDSSALVRTHDAVVSRAVGLMLQHPESPLSASALARHLGLSRRALEIRFQRAIGHGPATELRRRRMELTRHLLVNTDLTLEQISERAGYAGAHHLAARFKIETGLTAGAYRKTARMRLATHDKNTHDGRRNKR